MNFNQWLSKNETDLRSMLKPVPQSPIHHAEGDVFTHTRMVRGQLNSAINYFKELITKNPVFRNFDPSFSREDINLLRIASYMHDIGKASATRIDGIPWQEIKPSNQSKITAHGHEDREHFEPMMQKLGEPWKTMYQKASLQDREDLWFVIEKHMSLTHKDGFGKNTLKQLMDTSGAYKNERKVKLLLVLILMDQSGRISLGDETNGDAALPQIGNAMIKSASSYKPKLPRNDATPTDPDGFLNYLKSKGLNPDQIQQAYQGKFGKQ